MAPRRKEGAEPTRRSTRTVSQSSPAAPEPSFVTTKRETEHPGDNPTAPKKAKFGLGVGDILPDVTVQDEEGNPVKIADITVDKGIVLFAYPKASTPGCTKQVTSTVAF